jgi:hypothetical protein
MDIASLPHHPYPPKEQSLLSHAIENIPKIWIKARIPLTLTTPIPWIITSFNIPGETGVWPSMRTGHPSMLNWIVMDIIQVMIDLLSIA